MSPTAPPIDRTRSLTGLAASAALLVIVAAAIAVSWPGIHWLIGYGPTPDFSFHPDDGRFVALARHFFHVTNLAEPYPYFMATQLFLVHLGLHDLLRRAVNDAVVLRCISLAYSAAGIALCYRFARLLDYSRLVALLTAYFVAVAPLHVISAHFGTADMSSLFLFYLTLLTAWRYRVAGGDAWFYATAALAGVALADKFYLPALVPPAMLVFDLPVARRRFAGFLAASVCVATFEAASLFSYTPVAFAGLIGMIAADNLVVHGGKAPPAQIVLYLWDVPTCCGVIATMLAVAEAGLRLRFLRRFSLPGRAARRAWLARPAAILIVSLVACAAAIVFAGVHFERHILVFVPPVALLAALAIARAMRWLVTAPRAAAIPGYAAIVIVLAAAGLDAAVTDQVYPNDLRVGLADFLARHDLTNVAATTSIYTELYGVTQVGGEPRSRVFIGCDLEYRRYQEAAAGNTVFHLSGGKQRANFYVALLAGKTSYHEIYRTTRKRFSIEDRFARGGWLPELDYYAPDECRAFERPAADQ